MPIRSAVVLVCSLLVLGVATRSPARSIAAPIPPDQVLRDAGLAIDSDSLARYLSDGIPLVHASSVDGELPFAFYRFGYYGTVMRVAANENVQSAVPALKALRDGNLPAIIQADLDLSVVAPPNYRGEASYEMWDLAEQQKLQSFRVGAAIAIEKLTGEPAASLIEATIQEWTPVVIEQVGNGSLDNDILNFFIALCRNATVHNSRAGIDAFIEVLDHPNGVVHFPGVSILQQWTGQTFGPEFDDSDTTKRAEIAKWKAWWSSNRESFVPDVKNIESLIPKRTPYPAPTTVRDRVWHAQAASLDYDGLYFGKQSIEWLEQNGHKQKRSLRKIVDDKNENLRVRGEALKWCAKFESKIPCDTLMNYVLRPPMPYFDSLKSTAIELIKQRYPDRFVESLKRAAETESSKDGFAGSRLAQIPGNEAYLASIFPSLRGDARYQAIQTFSRMDAPPVEAIEIALNDDDVSIAAFASIAADQPTVSSRLSQQARTALERWRTNPEFLVQRINLRTDKNPDVSEYEAVLDTITTDDAYAARTNRRFLQTLHGAKQYNSNLAAAPEAVAQMKRNAAIGILKCVAAYRTSRGRLEPLPAYPL